jgi:hypothetical protein
MTKITTDFVGTESAATTKARLTEILSFWGYNPAAYTTWGNARTDMNAVLSITSFGTIGASELAGSFLPKINALNDPSAVISSSLFADGEPGAFYDPSDLSTVFTDTAGTTPAVVGDPVARINDKSGRGNHATQSVLASRPILRQDGGLHYLEFDGVDDGMSTGTITPGTDKVQVFAGVRKLSDAVSGAQDIVSNGAAFSENGRFEFRSSWPSEDSRAYALLFRGTAWPGSGSITRLINAAPHSASAYGLASIQTPNSGTLSVNGTVNTRTGNFGTGNFSAQPLSIGSQSGTTAFFHGRIYSLVVRFGPNLDADRIALAEAYAAAKTGISL